MVMKWNNFKQVKFYRFWHSKLARDEFNELESEINDFFEELEEEEEEEEE